MKKSNTYLSTLLSILRKPWVLFTIFTIIGSLIFFFRFPNNFLEPNFYAEDGSTFLTNILNHGFISATFTTFNGYFIVGLYLLEGIGYLINLIFFNGYVLDLARSFSIASYIFFGALCALPFLLFKSRFGFLAIFAVFLLTAFVPLPGSDYAIIGTIGNAKFAFVYLAFLLIVYRHYLPEKRWKTTLVVDLLIALCAYTNISVYLLLLFTPLKYIGLIRKFKIKELFRLKSFRSLFGLALLLIPQLIIIKLYGVPSLAGYLDTPYELGSTVNLFLYRPILFPFFSFATKMMSDIIVILLLVAFFLVLFVALRRNRIVLIFGLVTICITTLLFVANRTGVSSLFLGYSSGGPDQFFYTQNLIICFLAGISAIAIANNFRSKIIKYGFISAFFIFIAALYIPSAGSYGENNFMQRSIRNVYVNAQSSCQTKKDTLNVQLYPVVSDQFQLKNLSRSEVCTKSLESYVPDTEILPTTPENGVYIKDASKIQFYQSFVSNYNGLSGISLLVLTYKQAVKGDYELTLYDASCSNVLRVTKVDNSQLRDARYARINFDRISDSKSRIYCFTIKNVGTVSPLALPQSTKGQYPQGDLTLDKTIQSDDLVLELHYTK